MFVSTTHQLIGFVQSNTSLPVRFIYKNNIKELIDEHTQVMQEHGRDNKYNY